MYLYLEKRKIMLYTARYEDFKPLFFTSIGGNFCNAVIDIDWFGMDDANHVDDEILIKIRH